MAEEELSLGELIQAIIGIMMTLLVLYIIFTFSGPLRAVDSAGQGTRISVGTMMLILDEFDRADVASLPDSRTLPDFYIEDGFYLVGFDATNGGGVQDKCKGDVVERPSMPGECLPGRACLCLCVEGSQCKGSYPTCKSFNNIKRVSVRGLANDNFLSPAKPAGYTGNELLVYGDCGIGWSTMTPSVMYVYASDSKDREIVFDSKAPSRKVVAKAPVASVVPTAVPNTPVAPAPAPTTPAQPAQPAAPIN
jgi:hypothetical protein